MNKQVQASALTRKALQIALLTCGISILALTSHSQEDIPQAIKPGDAIERQSSGGQKARFAPVCGEGTYIKLALEQHGIDVGARFPGANELPVLEFDSDPRANGEEVIELVCGAPNPTNFVVDSRRQDAAPGKFILKFLESRPASEKDRSLDEARRLIVSSTRHWRAARYAEALSLAVRCLEIRERELGHDDPDVGQALFNIGNIYGDIPNDEMAYDFYRRAIANRIRTVGPDDIYLAGIYNNYGLQLKNQGRYPEALEMLEKARGIREKALSPDHLLVASVLNSLANVYRERGEEAKAMDLYGRVLRIREKALGPDHPDVAMALNNAVDDRWDLDRQESMYLRALAIREAKLTADHPDIGQSLYNLARLYASAGQFDKAEPYARRSLDSFRRVLGASHPFVGTSLNLLAIVVRGRGQIAEAERLFEEAVALKERVDGPHHPHLGSTLANLANLYAMMGKTEKAARTLARANEIYDYNIRLNLNSGSETEKLGLIDYLGVISDLALTLTFEDKNHSNAFAPIAFESVLLRKGRVLDAMSESVRALRSRMNKEDAELLDAWSETNEKIAKLVVAGPSGEPVHDFRNKVVALEAERDRLERRFGARGAAALNSAPTKLEAIIKAIPADAALVEIAVYRPVIRKNFEFAQTDRSTALNKFRYAAFVLKGSGEISAIDLGDREAVDRELAHFRSALRDPYGRNVRSAAAAAGSRLFEPLRKAVGDARQILISPDGDLNLVPFEALANAKGEYLIQSYAFTYLSSGRDLLKRGTAGTSASEPVLIADPEFGDKVGSASGRPALKNGVTSARDFTETFFTPLSWTADEAKVIREMYPDAKLLSGTTARESELKRLPPPKFLHIATHGFFVENPVGMIGSGADGTRGVVPAVARRNPLLRSGLALAGANLRVQGDEDGILTALEVTGLDLYGSRLVVLSACDTGMGEVKAGEGVFGLRRAFKLAGAESLVMSLWPVSDQVTKELMTGYYKNLKQGLGRGEALRRVQLSLLARPARRHPFYWASFIQAGEWAPLD